MRFTIDDDTIDDDEYSMEDQVVDVDDADETSPAIPKNGRTSSKHFEVEVRREVDPPSFCCSKRALCWAAALALAGTACSAALTRNSWKGILYGNGFGTGGAEGTRGSGTAAQGDGGGVGSADVPGVDISMYDPGMDLLSGLPDCRGSEEEICTWENFRNTDESGNVVDCKFCSEYRSGTVVQSTVFH